MKEILLGSKTVRNFSTPYIIAEIGANHNGDMSLARQMIQSAAACGVDGVKFQSWTPTSLVSEEEYARNQSYSDSQKKHFGSLKEMVERYFLRPEQHHELRAYCQDVGVDFLSTPFSEGEADLLDECKVPFFKIASMDINNWQLLTYVAKLSRPVVLSTGMARLGEIDRALELMVQSGASDIALLHCISIYPPADADIHLRNITMLQQTFGLPVGFSDHSMGFSVPLASVALGACIIEKHFTTDKSLPGWDHEISADPSEMAILCAEAPRISAALGQYHRTVSAAEEQKKKQFRRSIVVCTDVPAGHVLKERDLTSKRPGAGLSPDLIPVLAGRELRRPLQADSLISWEDIR